MATGTAFKQKCPSCESSVPIKDQSLVGKKIECPRCKDRFVVEKPGKRFREDEIPDDEEEDLDEAEETEEEEEAPKKSAKGKSVAKKGKNDADEGDSEAKPAKKGNGKKVQDEEADEDEASDDEESGAKKPNKKLMMGLGLGGVGVALIGLASFLILGGKGDAPKKNAPPNPTPITQAPPPDEPKKDVPPPTPKEEKKPEPTNFPAGPELTNLLPNDSDHVLHLFAKELFDPTTPLNDAIFSSSEGATDKLGKARLGFPLSAVDDLIRAEKYGPGGWTYSVVHLSQAIDEDALKKALNLKAAAPIKNQGYWQADSPALERIGRFTLGVSHDVRAMSRSSERPTFIRIHNPQTLIVGDEAPIVALLEAEGQFKLLTQISTPAPSPTPSPSPTPGVTPVPGFTPISMPGTTPMTGTTPMPGTSPMPVTSPIPGTTPKPGTSPMPVTSPIPGTSPMPGTTPSPMPGSTPMPGTMPMPGTSPMPGGAGNVLDQSTFNGTELRPPAGGALKIEFKGSVATVYTIKGQVNVTYSVSGSQFNIEVGGGNSISGTIDGTVLNGIVKDGAQSWKFQVKAVAGPILQGQSPSAKIDPGKTPGPLLRPETYLTVRPALKAILDRMETRSLDSADKILASAVTDLDRARLVQVKDRTLYSARSVWDFSASLEDSQAKLRTVGTALVAKESRVFLIRTELEANTEADARDTLTALEERAGPSAIRWIERLFGHKVELVKSTTGVITPGDTANPGVGTPGTGIPGMPPGTGIPGTGIPGTGIPGTGIPGTGIPGTGIPGTGIPGKTPVPDAKPEASRLLFAKKGLVIEASLDLLLDQQAMGRVHGFATLAAAAFRAEVGIASPELRHQLAAALLTLGEKGVSEAGVAPGHYPPGTLRRPGVIGRAATDPSSRISWMATLLPYLGHNAIFGAIQFDQSWRAPGNWIAGRARIPQFQDPAYPERSFAIAPGAVGTEFGTTHIVGIAGVGLDAADYRANDPAIQSKRGVFGYNGAASIEEIRKGRGLSNTMMMVQVPHDGVAGVTPWIAGGGATVRGVPEKDSIAPFVLSVDRDGKPIQHKGKRGTYAMMADGSVRFIDANVSDDIFKAMAAFAGPAPADIEKSPAIHKIPAPEAPFKTVPTNEGLPKSKDAPKETTKEPAKEPASKEPASKEPASKEPAKEPAVKSDPVKESPAPEAKKDN